MPAARAASRSAAAIPGVIYGLANILDNAVDFAEQPGHDRSALVATTR